MPHQSAISKFSTGSGGGTVPGDLESNVQETRRANLIPQNHGLPAEIWCHIFRFCLTDGYAEPSSKVAPLLVAQVCSYWREVALSTSSLWTSIRICVQHGTWMDSGDAVSQLVDMWFSRSGSLPLSISFESFTWAPLAAFINCLSAYAHRWQKVSLKMPFASLYDLRDLDALYCPVLESVAFELTLSALVDELDEDHYDVRLFKHVPLLRQVSLFSRFHPVNIYAFNIPFRQLNLLSSNASLSTDECLNIFRQSPNLVRCKLEGIFLPSNAPPGQQPPLVTAPLQLPCLRYLSLVTDRDVAALLGCIELPNLSELDIRYVDTRHSSHEWSSPKFKQFLRGITSLQKLTLDSLPVQNELVEYVRLTPSLVRLDITDTSNQFLTDQFFYALTIHPLYSPSRVLVPNLQELRIAGNQSFSSSALAVAVRSRCHSDDNSRMRFPQFESPPTLLRRLELDAYRQSDPDPASALTMLNNKDNKFELIPHL